MNDKITMGVPYFQVPNDIFEIGLDKHELLVYMYLARCGNQESKAFPSYNKIAEKTGISRRKVIDTIKVLEDKTLLVKEKRYNFERGENYSNTYRVEHDVKSIGSAYHAPRSEQDAPYKETGYKEPNNILHNLDELNYDRFISFYLKTMKQYGLKHKRINENNFNYILKAIEILDMDVDIDDWEEAVEKHFEKLPKNNDGDILSFLKASARHFGVDVYTLAKTK